MTHLASPNATLASVAASHNLSIAELALWLTRSDTRAHIHQLESGAYTHTRLAASMNLTHAVYALVQILKDFAAHSRTNSTTSPSPSAQAAPDSSTSGAPEHAPDRATGPADTNPRLDLRRAEGARKAAWLLSQLARLTPISEADLNRTRHPAIPRQTTRHPTQDTTQHTSQHTTSQCTHQLKHDLAPTHMRDYQPDDASYHQPDHAPTLPSQHTSHHATQQPTQAANQPTTQREVPPAHTREPRDSFRVWSPPTHSFQSQANPSHISKPLARVAHPTRPRDLIRAATGPPLPLKQ